MTWQNILKLDDYVQRRISMLKEKLKRANPEDTDVIQAQIEYMPRRILSFRKIRLMHQLKCIMIPVM